MKTLLIYFFSAFCALAWATDLYNENEERGFGKPDNTFNCVTSISKCVSDAQSKFIKSAKDLGKEEVLKALRRIEVKDVCKEVNKGKECVQQQLKKSECNELSRVNKKSYERAVEFVNYLCVDKLREIGRYWDCFLSSEFIQNIQSCVEKDRIDLQKNCNTEPIAKCAVEAVRNTRACMLSAKFLVRDIVEKGVKISPDCHDK